MGLLLVGVVSFLSPSQPQTLNSTLSGLPLYNFFYDFFNNSVVVIILLIFNILTLISTIFGFFKLSFIETTAKETEDIGIQKIEEGLVHPLPLTFFSYKTWGRLAFVFLIAANLSRISIPILAHVTVCYALYAILFGLIAVIYFKRGQNLAGNGEMTRAALFQIPQLFIITLIAAFNSAL